MSQFINNFHPTGANITYKICITPSDVIAQFGKDPHIIMQEKYKNPVHCQVFEWQWLQQSQTHTGYSTSSPFYVGPNYMYCCTIHMQCTANLYSCLSVFSSLGIVQNSIRHTQISTMTILII